MTTTRRYIFFFAIIILTTSYIDKDLNEYGKWLKFYDLKDEDFRQIGTDKHENLNWTKYNLTTEYKKLYDILFFYSPDSTYFLDLDSYSILLEKKTNGKLTWEGADPETKVQLVKTKKLSAATLLFFGTQDYIETAIWRNKYLFEVCGFRILDKKFVPTIWKYDLDKKTSKVFSSVKTFTSRPKSYLFSERLKTIDRK